MSHRSPKAEHGLEQARILLEISDRVAAPESLAHMHHAPTSTLGAQKFPLVASACPASD